MALRPPSSLTIRTRLLLYCVCIVAITAVAISAVTAVLASRDAHQRVVGQLESVATLKEQELDSWTVGLGLNLDIVLSGSGIRADLRELEAARHGSRAYGHAYRNALRRFVWASARMGLFEELFFMGPHGQVLLSTDQGHEGQQLGVNDYFTQGRRGEFIQEPSYSLSLNEMTVVASCPVYHRGLLAGVLAGRANLHSLDAIMVEHAGLGATGETYLVGSNHALLTDLRHPGYAIPDTYIRTYGADAALDAGRSGHAAYVGYAHDKVIGVYRAIPRLRVALLAEQDQAEALHATRVALLTAGGVALVAALLAILAGTLLIRSIVRPLRALGVTAGRIAAGELDLTADASRHDEIGALAGSFNRMTGQLRDLVRSLEKRTHHLRAINDAGRQISSVLELDELLPHVAGSLLRTFDYESVRILLLDGEGGGRLLSCGRGACEESREVRLDELGELPALQAVARSGEPLLESSAADEGADGERVSQMAVAIRVSDTPAGVLHITARGRHPLDEQDLFAATTIADQLAIAVENARLYHNARELAASRERQRLARDLHDAVSQTLFSVSLIAEVLPRIFERDPAQGQERLEELRQLTRGALAEMRMLLLELRPASLAETSLPDLLRQLSEAVIGRARIPIDVSLEAGEQIPPEVAVALYRIAQEALNNVAKHAGAGHAAVRLSESHEHGAATLELTVQDDGCGFDPADTRAGRLGLAIMAERAESIGADLELRSACGAGTRVHVAWRR
jgi:nitrate/nitrite-specific signal transduction histidine kinase